MDRGLSVSVWEIGPGKRLGQTGSPGSLGCGRGMVCSALREQWSPSPFGTDGVGCAADPAAVEMQRPMAGEARWRKPVSAIFHRDEGVRGMSIRASTLVAFRKRFSEENLAAILEASVPKVGREK